MSLKEIVGFIMQGGIAIVVFIIWYFTFTKADKRAAEQQRQQNEQSTAAFKKHTELNATLIQLLKDEQEYKTVLTGVLDRLDAKLAIPAQCPMLMSGKKIKFEVME